MERRGEERRGEERRGEERRGEERRGEERRGEEKRGRQGHARTRAGLTTQQHAEINMHAEHGITRSQRTMSSACVWRMASSGSITPVDTAFRNRTHSELLTVLMALR